MKALRLAYGSTKQWRWIQEDHNEQVVVPKTKDCSTNWCEEGPLLPPQST